MHIKQILANTSRYRFTNTLVQQLILHMNLWLD